MSGKKLILALIVASVSVPAMAAPESFSIDPDHTFPSLEFSHLGISVWRGKFNKTSGSIVLDRAARTGTAEVQVDIKSIDFGHDKMNEHALAPDWLDAEKYPAMTYKGSIKFKGNMPASVDGELTLRGVTKPVKLKINSFKCIQHPFYKKEVCGADAEGEINRADFGLTKYAEGEAGKVRMRIQVEALKQD